MGPYINIDDVTEGRIRTLIEAGAPETLVLDFKREPYAGGDDGSRETLKDLTAFANTSGGLLLIGVDEADGCASDIVAMTPDIADRQINRIIHLLTDAVYPRINGVQTRLIPVMGGFIIAIKVPRSVVAPHRVVGKGSNRYFLRQATHNFEASHDQLRNMFAMADQWAGRIREFRDERLIALKTNRAPVPHHLIQKERTAQFLALHILPLGTEALGGRVDLNAAFHNDQNFRPKSEGSYTPRINADGFIIKSSVDHTQLFRDGSVEGVIWGCASDYENGQYISALEIVTHIIDRVEGFISGLHNVGGVPPFFISIVLGNVRDFPVICSPTWSNHQKPDYLVIDDLVLPVCVIEDFGTRATYIEALRPAFDALWNAGGKVAWPGP